MDDPERELDVLFGTSLSWVHTRTGRSLLEASISYHPMTYREPSYGDSPGDVIERDFYRSLFGRDEFTMHVLGAIFGVGWRFGTLPRRPWEFFFRYHLDRYHFPDGILGDQDPLLAHGLTISFVRSFAFGGELFRTDTEAPRSVDSEQYTDLPSARSAAEDKWQPSRLAVFVDPGGVLGWGPRFGLEWHLSDRWSLSAWGRQYIGESRFSPAGVLTRNMYKDRLIPDGYAFPGIGVRRYFREDRRGWYAGGVLELMSFDNLRAESSWEFDDRTVELDGRLVPVQLEGGYRMRIWRSLSLDAGVKAGWSFGLVDQDTDGVHNPWGPLPWYNAVIAISTPVF